ncbi:hypothetical protein JN11_01746 [Mucilaginibacter frigoritolerans]|jgi:uncharacterized membrane protein YdbT with pleckstrin-like domain|uniref:Magnesium citrate secondary transporter n=1 Tax=Mucilaginibacter frigoritolerans TaxID=652788 RepID=A0A562U857_9SPHI|nr:hypothetical protein [Mucilaginibacter frigoritolerans]TWJ01595.1 hypothetical protein JN11_01746 [Mucilaginibacter frigoritolerans]
MKTLLNPWFIIGCLTWAIVLVLRRTSHPLPYINGYINDVFAIPVIANLGLWFNRVFIIKSNHYVLSKRQVAFIVIYVAIVFEGFLPYLSKTYTADWIDVLLYILGGLFFYRVMNKARMEQRSS